MPPLASCHLCINRMHPVNVFALMPRRHLLLSCATKGGKNALNGPQVSSPGLKTEKLSTLPQGPPASRNKCTGLLTANGNPSLPLEVIPPLGGGNAAQR